MAPLEPNTFISKTSSCICKPFLLSCRQRRSRERQGPVWLRSSNHKLPDLVFDLHGLVDVEVSGRIDSARGGIRASLENSPDAPLSKVELRMQGGKKGLIINSRNLCGAISKANVQFDGHNGKQSTANPVMRPDGCGGKPKGGRTR